MSFYEGQSHNLTRRQRMQVLLHEYRIKAKTTLDTSSFRNNGELVSVQDIIEVLDQVRDWLFDLDENIKE